METTLRLPLIRHWFELTKAGIKTEDYRLITPYWVKRLTLCDVHPEIAAQELNTGSLPIGCFNRNFTHNIMTLGYPSATDTDRILRLEHKGIEIRTGNPEWGAEPGKLYFVIKHGAIL
jgi:hypothetical protein